MDYLRDKPDLNSVPLLPSAADTATLRLLVTAAIPINRLRTGNRVWRAGLRLAWDAAEVPMRCFSGQYRRKIETFDVIHSPFYPLPEYVVGTGLSRFLTIYDMVPILFPHLCKPGIRALFSRILASLRPDDWVLCISESTKRDFCSITGFDPARVFVTHLGASTATFRRCDDASRMEAARAKYGIPPGPYALSLSTLEPRKNIQDALTAFAHLVRQENIPDLTFVLVGARGWGSKTLDVALQRYAWLKDRIIVTGYVDDADLAPLYSGAMMFVYVPLYEGFGVPPLEAMQCGTPVITSNTSSLPEVIGDAGLMVSPGHPEDLCQNMLQLYRSDSLRTQLSSQALERARRFSWEKCVRQTLDAYRVGVASA
jgi:glycosyltransferase involved in cell wall biosynthesis